jgi:hypothetical protein
MADRSKTKKRRLETENSLFQEKLAKTWCFVENKGTSLTTELTKKVTESKTIFINFNMQQNKWNR